MQKVDGGGGSDRDRDRDRDRQSLLSDIVILYIYQFYHVCYV